MPNKLYFIAKFNFCLFRGDKAETSQGYVVEGDSSISCHLSVASCAITSKQAVMSEAKERVFWAIFFELEHLFVT